MPIISAIFDAITGIPSLIKAGQQVYEAVTGKPSAATTPTDLQADIAALPPDQQAAWASQMQGQIDLYKAQTERLSIEEGELTADVLNAIPAEARAKVALYRMTTRPWAVRWMVRYMLIPFYVMLVDGTLSIANILLHAFHVTMNDAPVRFELLGATFLAEGSIYQNMYATGVAWAAGIVITYMGLRSAEKGGQSPLDAVTSAISSVTKLFKK